MLLLSLLLAVSGCPERLAPAAQALQSKDVARARSLLQQSGADCAASSEYYELLGVIEEFSGERKGAEEHLQEAVRLNPSSARLLTELGVTLLRHGQPSPAAQALERSLRLQPADHQTAKYLLGSYLQQQQWANASQLLARTQLDMDASVAADPLLYVWIAQTLLEAKQTSRLNRWLAQSPQTLPAASLFSLGKMFAEHNDHQKTVSYLSRISPAEADDAVAFNLGVAYSHLREFEQARSCYFRAIDKHPDHATAYFRIGQDFATAGEGRKAIPWLWRAHQLAPERADMRYALAEQLLRFGYTDSAGAIIQEGLTTSPSDLLLLVAKADVQQARNNFAGSESLYRSVLAAKPDLAPALTGLARSLRGEGKNGEARPLLERVLAIDRNDMAAKTQLGLIDADEGSWLRAIDRLADVWKRDQSDVAAGFSLANAYRHAGQPANALLVLKQIEQSAPDSEAVHVQMAQTYNALGQRANASAENRIVSQSQAQARRQLHFESAQTYVH